MSTNTLRQILTMKQIPNPQLPKPVKLTSLPRGILICTSSTSRAKLKVANSQNGDKVLYEVYPIEKVGQDETLSKSTTKSRIQQPTPNVNKYSSANTDNETDTTKVAATKLRPAYFELLTYSQNHPNATMDELEGKAIDLIANPILDSMKTLKNEEAQEMLADIKKMRFRLSDEQLDEIKYIYGRVQHWLSNTSAKFVFNK